MFQSCKHAALLQFSYDHVGSPDGVRRQRDLVESVEVFRVPDQELVCPHLKAAAGGDAKASSWVPRSPAVKPNSGSFSHLSGPDAGGDALSLSSLETQTRTWLEAELLRPQEPRSSLETYHVQDRQQDEVHVDPGHAGPVVNGPNAAVVPPEEGPGQLVQRRPLVLLRSTFRPC